MKAALIIAAGCLGLLVLFCAVGLVWLWAGTDIDRYGDDE